jgi:hypothetical protein
MERSKVFFYEEILVVQKRWRERGPMALYSYLLSLISRESKELGEYVSCLFESDCFFTQWIDLLPSSSSSEVEVAVLTIACF